MDRISSWNACIFNSMFAASTVDFSIKPASASPLEGAGGCGPLDGAGGVGKGVGIVGGPAETGPLVRIVWQTV